MIEAIVLAAGKGERLGTIKPLLLIDNEPALAQVIRTVKQTAVRQIIVVLGYAADEIMNTIASTQEIIPLETPEQRTGPARRYRFKDGVGELGFISPVSDHFCGSCNRLRLTADGKLRVCLFSDSEIDVREAIRAGCSDEEIRELLFTAVKDKPESHQINENIFKKCSKTMSLIGG